MGTEDYEYHYMDWYQIPKLLGRPYWSEPYYDEGGANIMMTTFSLPLYDSNGKMYAVFTADISLEWFADKVNEIKPYPRSYNYMIGRGGTFLVSDRKEAILNESFFASPMEEGDKNMIETGHRMINGEKGMTQFDHNGTNFYFFFAPVQATGWSVAVICMDDDVFAGVDSLRNRVLIVFLFGLLFLAGFIVAGLDFRFGWSKVPLWCVIGASVLFIVGYAMYAEVMRENAYLSRTVKVQENQKVIDTGLYGIIRHPMYTATIFMFIMIPLILGSLISFIIFLAYPFTIAIRIKNEEQVLEKELNGYIDYKKKVKYKILPFIW